MAITPISDGVLEDLLRFTRDYLNKAANDWAIAAGEQPLLAVADIKPIQCTLEAVQKLPLLSCYRIQLETPNSAEPLSHSVARMDYFVMSNMQNRERQDALFTWAAKQIAQCFEVYDSGEVECLQVKMDTIEASIRYTVARGASGPITIPFLRIQFGFEDYEIPEPR